MRAAEPLTIKFRMLYVVPLAWKRSNVTPVHKGGETLDPGNFCPISVVAKVLEKVIATQLSIVAPLCMQTCM